MSSSRFTVLGCALAALVLSGCVGLSVAERNAEHARRTSRLLAAEHVTRRAPDDIISQRAWTNILESCDADHLVFRAEDIRRFDARRLLLDDAMRASDFSFVRDVRALYRTRLAERVAFVRETLKTNLASLPKTGTYRFDRKALPWPANRAEQDNLWRARLANDILEEELGRKTKSKKSNSVGSPAEVVLKRYESQLSSKPLTDVEAADLFLSAIVRAYDPHSLYLAPDEYSIFQSEMNLKLCGVGAQLEFTAKGAEVTRVLSGGPIEKDGHIHAGDCIVGVAKDGDGKIEPLAGKSQMEGIKMLRGEKNSKVTLEVAHKGESGTKTYTLTRTEIKLEDDAASSRVVTVGGKKLGYLRLPQFYAEMTDDVAGFLGRRTCSDDLKKQLIALRKAKVEGVVFDLRDNPGGSLDDAVKILGFFLRGGPAVSLKNPSREVVLPIPENTVLCEVPVVVLTTRGSASASELVSGSLQDYGRAIVVGDDHTFGKGTAQEPKELEDVGDEPCAVMLTGDLFYRAGGASTQRCGVEANIVVPSIAGDLDDGEEKMPYALPADRFVRKDFQPAWDLVKFVPELTRLSEARRAKSRQWQQYQPFVQQAKAYQERTANPLDRAAREAQMKADDALQREGRRLDKLMQGKKSVEQDPVLHEGVEILLDLVRLNAGRKLPARAESAVTGAFTNLDDD